jgi:hypothetical protein
MRGDTPFSHDWGILLEILLQINNVSLGRFSLMIGVGLIQLIVFFTSHS